MPQPDGTTSCPHSGVSLHQGLLPLAQPGSRGCSGLTEARGPTSHGISSCTPRSSPSPIQPHLIPPLHGPGPASHSRPGAPLPSAGGNTFFLSVELHGGEAAGKKPRVLAGYLHPAASGASLIPSMSPHAPQALLQPCQPHPCPHPIPVLTLISSYPVPIPTPSLSSSHPQSISHLI